MTRRFEGQVHCPHCGKWHTAETAFERWVRNHPGLDSRGAGIVRFDLDLLLHKYMTPTDKRGTRDVQAMMFIEVKTHGADVLLTQQDSFSLLAQIMRNRRKNMHANRKGRHAYDHIAPSRAYSHVIRKYVRLRLLGGHLLRLEHDSPDDGGRITWDNKPIDLDMLVGLLRFDIDPDTLEPMNWRRRYSNFEAERQQLWLPAMKEPEPPQ